MNLIVAAFLIGFSAGMRALTAPAIVAWAAYCGFVDLSGSSLSFVASPITVGVLTLLAVGEYVGDKLPNTPNRTAAPGLIARLFTAAFSALCLTHAVVPAAVAAVAAVVAAYGCMTARRSLGRKLGVRDIYVAVPEDIVAIALAVVSVAIATGFAATNPL